MNGGVVYPLRNASSAVSGAVPASIPRICSFGTFMVYQETYRSVMAQQNTNAMDALAENENVDIQDVTAADGEWTHLVFVYGEARTSGPALDPVQAAEAHGDLRAHQFGDTQASTAYHVEVLA